MSIRVDHFLSPIILRAQALGLPFVLQPPTHQDNPYSLIQCQELDAQERLSRISFQINQIIPQQYILKIDQKTLEDNTEYFSPIAEDNSPVLFKAYQAIVRSTSVFAGTDDYERHIEQKCIETSPGYSEPCGGCLQRVHALAILAGYLLECAKNPLNSEEESGRLQRLAQVTIICYSELIKKQYPEDNAEPLSPSRLLSRSSSRCSLSSRPGTPFKGLKTLS